MKPTFPNMLWTIIWSQGPHDNPTDGTCEVEAQSLADAYQQAINAKRIPYDAIDGIIRSDIWEDL